MDDVHVHRLRHLHQVLGWRFRIKGWPDADELVYFRAHGDWVDILRVRSPNDAMAGRFLAESLRVGRPKACWQAEGTLGYVLDKVGEL